MAKAQNEAWGLEYIDLYLIHFPIALEYVDPEKRRYPGWWKDDAGNISTAKVPIRETWEALEEIVDAGLVKSIGVSNFQAQVQAPFSLHVSFTVQHLALLEYRASFREHVKCLFSYELRVHRYRAMLTFYPISGNL